MIENIAYGREKVKEDLEDTRRVVWWWAVGIGLIMLTIFMFTVARPWYLAQEREQNKQSQQYQDTKIRESRDLVAGIHNSNSTAQQAVLIERFCASFTEIKSPPPDLVKANTAYCT